MTAKKAIIIGAGVAGLSTGYYLQNSGFDTRIFEMDSNPGGLCTCSNEKKSIFDVNMQWIWGTNPESCYNKIWRELNAFSQDDVLDLDIVKAIEYDKDNFFYIFSDLNRLKEEMLKISPEDSIYINELLENAKKFSSTKIPLVNPMEILDLPGIFKIFKQNFECMTIFNKYKKTNINDFISKLKNEKLRKIISGILGKDVYPLINLIMFLGAIHIKSIGFLKGGSKTLVENLVNGYLEAGGAIHYGKMVKTIVVESDAVRGVIVEDEAIYDADIVISAADGFNTIFELLKGKYISLEIKDIYQRFPIFPPIIQVNAEINHEFKEKPHLMTLKLIEPIFSSERKNIKVLNVQFLNFATACAKEGKTTIVAQFETDYDYWKSLWISDIDAYNQEKERISSAVLKILDDRFGCIMDNIEAVDIFTPIAYAKCSGNWRGSIRGWLSTLETLKIRMPRKLPGLKNFYMAGQWVELGGGLHNVALSGRNIAQLVCRDLGSRFGKSGGGL